MSTLTAGTIKLSAGNLVLNNTSGTSSLNGCTLTAGTGKVYAKKATSLDTTGTTPYNLDIADSGITTVLVDTGLTVSGVFNIKGGTLDLSSAGTTILSGVSNPLVLDSGSDIIGGGSINLTGNVGTITNEITGSTMNFNLTIGLSASYIITSHIKCSTFWFYVDIAGTCTLTLTGAYIECTSSSSQAFKATKNTGVQNIIANGATVIRSPGITIACSTFTSGGAEKFEATGVFDVSNTAGDFVCHEVEHDGPACIISKGFNPADWHAVPGTKMTIAVGIHIRPTTGMSMDGTLGNVITLEPSAASTYFVDSQAGANNLSYIDVSYCDASGSVAGIVATHSNDGGNNASWTITP